MERFDEDFAAPRWKPPRGTVTHDGRPIPDDADFFAPPPPGIGQIASADSTLKIGRQKMGTAMRWVIILGVAAICTYLTALFFAWILVRPTFEVEVTSGYLLIGALTMGPVGAWVTFAITYFRHSCTYLGTEGAARWDLFGSRNSEPLLSHLVYSAAAHLFTQRITKVYNGIPVATKFQFVWVDESGVSVFALAGNYLTEKDPSDYGFARAVEAAWSTHRLAERRPELTEHGFVEFPLGNGDAVRIAPEFLEVQRSYGIDRISIDEIEKVMLRDGAILVRTKDARWLGSEGKFKFEYFAMRDGQMLVLALQEIAGLEIQT